MRMVEVCAMVDSSLFTWSTAKDFGTPCVAGRSQLTLRSVKLQSFLYQEKLHCHFADPGVHYCQTVISFFGRVRNEMDMIDSQMAVKVDDTDRAVRSVHAPE